VAAKAKRKLGPQNQLSHTLANIQQTRKPETFTQSNRTITFKNEPEKNPQNTAECFNNQFTNLTKHKTSKINRQIDKEIRKLPMDSTTVTPTEVQNAIKNSKTNNSSGPDNISIHHLKHLGPTAITCLTKLYNLVLKDNTIPQIWKLSKVIPIPKPNKDPNLGSSYRPISLLSPLAKTLEKNPTTPNDTESSQHTNTTRLQT
jgi:hypothetical protein